ncbi:MAG: hypothetical protein RLZZ621_2052 [Gemmatimonadota bacterium]
MSTDITRVGARGLPTSIQTSLATSPTAAPLTAPAASTSAPFPVPNAVPLDAIEALPPLPGVAPAAPETLGDPEVVPLGRSGVDAREVVLTRDELLTRVAVSAGEVEQGLQQARGSLVRKQPSEALASLDAIWQRADTSEEAWYLRSGALTVMGMPEDGDRVAGEALQQQPTSLALRLAQSVARAVQGDVGGAREALLPALDEAPDEPVLLAQRAVLNARAGRGEAADDGVRRLQREFGAHPATEWARDTVRREAAERVRQQARAVSVGETSGSAGDPTFTDITDTIFRGLGASLPVKRGESVVQEARVLMRAFSGGGTMATVAAPEQAHAARSVLVGLIAVLTGGEPGARQPGVLLAQLVPLLRDGRIDDAARALKRGGDAASPAVRRLLEALVSGPRLGDGAMFDGDRAFAAVQESQGEARAEVRSESRSASRGDGGTRGPHVQGEDDDGALVPLRFGLGLLRETVQDRAIRAAMAEGAALTAQLEGQGELPVLGPDEAWRVLASRVPGAPTSESVTGVVGAEGEGRGWGAARAAASWDGDTERPADSSLGLALLVVVAVVVGGGVALRGGAMAVLLMGALLWYALRPRGGSR